MSLRSLYYDWFGEPHCYGRIHYAGFALRRLVIAGLARLPLLRLLPRLEKYGDRLLVLTFRDYKYNWFWYAKYRTMAEATEMFGRAWSAALAGPKSPSAGGRP